MKLTIILLGVLLGIFTSCYVLDIRIKNILNYDKKIQLKGLIICILYISVTLLLYNNYGYSNKYISILLTMWFLISVSITDWRDKMIPINILVLTIILGVILLFFNPNIILHEALIGFFLVGGIIALVSVISRKAIGIGDALVIGIIGLILGYKMALTVLVYSIVLCGIVGLLLITLRKVNRKTQLPMVPFMLVVFTIIIII